MHDDQVSQNARAEEEELWRAWGEFSGEEKAAALRSLAQFMHESQHPRWTAEANAMALLQALYLDQNLNGKSPIAWDSLSKTDLADRLMEVSDWSIGTAGMTPLYLAEACLDTAGDVLRERQRQWEEKER